VTPATVLQPTSTAFGAGAPVDRWVAQLERPEDCLACGICQGACAQGAITLAGRAAAFAVRMDPTLCSGCGDCVDACPQEALALRAAEAGS
jgi:NAD-dependent dihydropyrimidine dehydrogenase PreA subunit